MAETAKVNSRNLFYELGAKAKEKAGPIIDMVKDTIVKSNPAYVPLKAGTASLEATGDFVRGAAGLSPRTTQQPGAVQNPQPTPAQAASLDTASQIGTGVATTPGAGYIAVTGPAPRQGGLRQTAAGVSPYEISDVTNQGETDRFTQQPTRPGTRMRSGLRQPGQPSVREQYFARNQARRNYDPGVSLAGGGGNDSRVGVNYWRDQREDNATRLAEAGLQSDAVLGAAGIRERGATQRNILDNELVAENNESLAGLRSAQTRQAEAAVEAGNYGTLTIEEPIGDPRLGNTRQREIPYNKKTGEIMGQGATPQLGAQFATLTPEQQAQIRSTFQGRSNVTPQEVQEAIAAMKG